MLSVYIKDHVFSWIFTHYIRWTLFNEFGYPFGKVLTCLDSSIFENNVAMLIQLRSDKLPVEFHSWFDCQNVWYSQLIKAWDDKVLKILWTINFLLGNLITICNSKSIKCAFSIPKVAWPFYCLFVNMFSALFIHYALLWIFTSS